VISPTRRAAMFRPVSLLVAMALTNIVTSKAVSVGPPELLDAIRTWWSVKGAEAKFLTECQSSLNQLCGSKNCLWRAEEHGNDVEKTKAANIEEMSHWIHRHMNTTFTKLMVPLCNPMTETRIRAEGLDCNDSVTDKTIKQANVAWEAALGKEDAFKTHAHDFALLLPVIQKVWSCNYYAPEFRGQWINTQILNPSVGLFEMPSMLRRYNTGPEANKIGMEMSWFWIKQGTGYPLHSHAALEAYYVLGETEFGFAIDGTIPPVKVKAPVGKWLCIPPNVLHALTTPNSDHVSISSVEAFAGANQLRYMDNSEQIAKDGGFDFDIGALAESTAPESTILMPKSSKKSIPYDEYKTGWMQASDNGHIPVEYYPKYGAHGGEKGWFPLPGWEHFNMSDYKVAPTGEWVNPPACKGTVPPPEEELSTASSGLEAEAIEGELSDFDADGLEESMIAQEEGQQSLGQIADGLEEKYDGTVGTDGKMLNSLHHAGLPLWGFIALACVGGASMGAGIMAAVRSPRNYALLE